MKKLSQLTVFLEKLFWAFLFINPFLDIINGLYINLILKVDVLEIKSTSTLGITPSLIIRMLMLVVFACYVLLIRDKKSILSAAAIGVGWIASMAAEYMSRGGAQWFLDTQYTARFCYNIVLFMVYTSVFAKRWGSDGKALIKALDDVMAFTLTVLSFSILASAVVGIGYSTYADRMGYRGSRGFFYAGNDITAVLTVLLPVNVARLMKMDRGADKKRSIIYAVAGGLGANALMIIGSKTAFIAVAGTYAVMLAAAVWAACKGRARQECAGFGIALGTALVIFGILMLLSGMELWYSIVDSFNVTGELAANEGVETAIFSGRQDKLGDHLAQFKAGGPVVWLFGMGRGSQTEILEMDVFEVIFYYGIFGTAAFLWLYAKAAIDFLKSFVKKRDVITLALFTAIGMCAGYLIIAGHVLFSVTSGFYFVFVIIYSRVHFADSAEDILLWRCREK